MKVPWLGLMVLPLLLSTPIYAQDSRPPHYKVVDLGSFGGGNSYAQGVFLPFFPGTKTLNSFGIDAAWGDTSTPDPFSPNCYADCFVGYALKWQGDGTTNLGAFPQNPALGRQEPCFDCAWSSFPLAISDSGLIVGESEDNSTDPLTEGPVSFAAVWRDGKIINLGTLGGNQSGAIGVNNWGVVVGGALVKDTGTYSVRPPYYDVFLFGSGTASHAFWWLDGQMHDLQTLGGDDSIALFVNDLGQIAGASDADTNSDANQVENPGGPTVHPFLWQWGRMRDLIADAPPGSFGGTYGIVSSLNNRGQVIGVMNMGGDVTWHSFLWEYGKTKDIGTLGGDFATAHWVNDSGVIVGRSSVKETCDSCASGAQGQFSHPFIYKDGNMKDLGLPNGAQCATAKQINERGEIVGQSFLQVGSVSLDFCGSAATGAFVVYPDGALYDLQALLVPGSGITLNDAVNVNDRGEILGTGFSGNGDHRVVLLVPCD